MTKSAVFVQDTQSLNDLMRRLEHGADTMLSVRDAISNYLDGMVAVMENMERRAADLLETARSSLQNAEIALATAEEAMDDCGSVDNFDCYDDYDDFGYIDDDCDDIEEAENAVNAAREAVAAAQEEVERRKQNWIRAGHIVSECKDARGDWLVSIKPGCESGDAYLKFLGDRTLGDAKNKMLKIQEVLEKYLSVRFSNEAIASSNIPADGPEPLSGRAEAKLRERSIDYIKDKQVSGARHYGQADATQIVKCEQCGRPLTLCICRYKRHHK